MCLSISYVKKALNKRNIEQLKNQTRNQFNEKRPSAIHQHADKASPCQRWGVFSACQGFVRCKSITRRNRYTTVGLDFWQVSLWLGSQANMFERFHAIKDRESFFQNCFLWISTAIIRLRCTLLSTTLPRRNWCSFPHFNFHLLMKRRGKFPKRQKEKKKKIAKYSSERRSTLCR